MPVTFTFDPDFIYAMLKEYHDAVMAKNIGGSGLDEVYLAILQDDVIKQKGPLSCSVSAVPGGAKIVCIFDDSSDRAYTANSAVYRYRTGSTIYELFRVIFPEVTKGATDILSVTATAVLTVGQGGTPQLS